jgi:hypothetical protein
VIVFYFYIVRLITSPDKTDAPFGYLYEYYARPSAHLSVFPTGCGEEREDPLYLPQRVAPEGGHKFFFLRVDGSFWLSPVSHNSSGSLSLKLIITAGVMFIGTSVKKPALNAGGKAELALFKRFPVRFGCLSPNP